MNSKPELEETLTEQLTMQCVCERTVELDVLEDYDMPTFVGACPCGRVWQLVEVSGFSPVAEE